MDLMLARSDHGARSPGAILREINKPFSETDVYQEGPSMTLEEFEAARASWKSGNTPWKNTLVSRVSQDKMLAAAGLYFDAAVRTLESFVSPEYDGLPIKKYFGALSEAMKVSSFSCASPLTHTPIHPSTRS